MYIKTEDFIVATAIRFGMTPTLESIAPTIVDAIYWRQKNKCKLAILFLNITFYLSRYRFGSVRLLFGLCVTLSFLDDGRYGENIDIHGHQNAS